MINLEPRFAGFSGMVLLLLLSMFSSTALSAELAGKVEAVTGTVWAQDAQGNRRQLEEGSPFYVNDLLITEADSNIQVRFQDDTKFYMGEEAQLLIQDFIYKKPERENSFSAKILKGTFRFISGLIASARPDSMEVQTSVATIGIRGTHVVGEADSTSATIILMEPEGEDRDTSILVANEYGSVVIDKPGYGTEIPDQYSPPSPPRRMRLQTIDNIMRSMQSIQRVNIPRPRMPR